MRHAYIHKEKLRRQISSLDNPIFSLAKLRDSFSSLFHSISKVQLTERRIAFICPVCHQTRCPFFLGTGNGVQPTTTTTRGNTNYSSNSTTYRLTSSQFFYISLLTDSLSGVAGGRKGPRRTHSHTHTHTGTVPSRQ